MKRHLCPEGTSLLAAILLASSAAGQEAPLAWQATRHFEYTIDRIDYDAATGNTKVVFAVLHPTDLSNPVWDVKNDPPFKGAARLNVIIGWDTSEYTNTGSNNGSLNPLTAPRSGAALPVSVNALTAAQPCTPDTCGIVGARRYFITSKITPLQFPNGRVVANGVAGIDGHPVCTATLPDCPPPTVVNGVATFSNVPVKNAVKYFSLTGGAAVPRREIVDIAKCQKCHDGLKHGDTVVPRLSLHGANRNEELKLCVVCHNPNQTDIVYRTSGAEVSIDFKRMIHSIHAGGFRETPYSVVGFQGTVADFSRVRFPAALRDCTKCHIDRNGKGTFELPVASTSLGSTVNTQSVLSPVKTVDVNPNNDLKITPVAATCSGCHDKAEVQRHMVTRGGASFSTLQQNAPAERCASCHGPGREESVRRAHEIGSR